MSENKYTPGPWTTKQSRLYGNETMLVDKDDHYIASIRANSDLSDGDSQDIARRITACVNACAGCATEVLETVPVGFFNSTYGHPKYLEEITKQCDELNRLCEFNEKTMQFLLDVINYIVDEAKLTSSQYELCRQAIACVIVEQ